MIEATMKKNALGMTEQVTFRWVGKSPYVYVRGSALDDLGISTSHASFFVGPYRLLKVERFPESDEWLCVRSGRLGSLRVLVYRATRWLDWFYRRSIVVLAIYGAAEHHAACIPSWRDVYVLKWLSKVAKHD